MVHTHQVKCPNNQNNQMNLAIPFLQSVIVLIFTFITEFYLNIPWYTGDNTEHVKQGLKNFLVMVCRTCWNTSHKPRMQGDLKKKNVSCVSWETPQFHIILNILSVQHKSFYFLLFRCKTPYYQSIFIQSLTFPGTHIWQSSHAPHLNQWYSFIVFYLVQIVFLA